MNNTSQRRTAGLYSSSPNCLKMLSRIGKLMVNGDFTEEQVCKLRTFEDVERFSALTQDCVRAFEDKNGVTKKKFDLKVKYSSDPIFHSL